MITIVENIFHRYAYKIILDTYSGLSFLFGCLGISSPSANLCKGEENDFGRWYSRRWFCGGHSLLSLVFIYWMKTKAFAVPAALNKGHNNSKVLTYPDTHKFIALSNFQSLQKSEILIEFLETKGLRLSVLKWEVTFLKLVRSRCCLYRGSILNIWVYRYNLQSMNHCFSPMSCLAVQPLLFPLCCQLLEISSVFQVCVSNLWIKMQNVYFLSSLWLPITTKKEHVRDGILPEVRKTSRNFCPWNSCV